MPLRDSNQAYGQSANRADYQAAFLTRVHRLLQLAYQSLTPSAYARSEEDDITGDLCKHMRHLTESAPLERWMARFSVHDQDPSNDVTAATTGLPRKGKRRPKIDIRLVCKHRTPNSAYCIEAKRLYRSDSVSEYVDDEGLGAFICGDYAVRDECAGMMGYVQSDTVSKWLSKIEAKLKGSASVRFSTNGRILEPIRFASGPVNCYMSRHLRNNGCMMVLYHVMLRFGASS